MTRATTPFDVVLEGGPFDGSVRSYAGPPLMREVAIPFSSLVHLGEPDTRPALYAWDGRRDSRDRPRLHHRR
jgi:hypothetical protein